MRNASCAPDMNVCFEPDLTIQMLSLAFKRENSHGLSPFITRV